MMRHSLNSLHSNGVRSTALRLPFAASAAARCFLFAFAFAFAVAAAGGESAFALRDKPWSEVFTEAIHDKYSEVFGDESAFASVVYIDPGYTGGGSDGSKERPLTSLNHVSMSASDVAYLIKRGTSHRISNIAFTGNRVMVGAYGEGDRPHTHGSRLLFYGSDCLIRDQDAEAFRHGSHGNYANALNLRVFNSRFHGTSSNTSFGRNYLFIGIEVLNNDRNGIFFQQLDVGQDSHIEIGYSYIHKVNQVWLPDGKPQSTASGDGIMFNPFRGTYHYHNNIIDRSDTGNKFCIIGNPAPNGGNAVYGLIENNFLYGPKSYPDGASAMYFGNIDGPSEAAHHHIEVRNNVVIGTSHPLGGDENRTGQGIYTNTARVTVYGNLFLDMRGGLTIGSGFGENIVYNNTFLKMYDRQRISGRTAYVYNNIFDENRMQTPDNAGNNLFLVRVREEDYFIDPKSEDYRLVEGSPAIGAGSWHPWMNNEWMVDMLGTAIPHDDTIDAGAFQYRESWGELPQPTEWAGYPILKGNWVDTGDLFGRLHIGLSPWIYAEDLRRWIYLPEENVLPPGAWWYAFR